MKKVITVVSNMSLLEMIIRAKKILSECSIFRKCYNLLSNNCNVIHNDEDYLDDGIKPTKKALLSYLCEPLYTPYDKTVFSNSGIARTIPRALNELGYSVDIVNWNCKNFIPKTEYDLFLAHGGKNFSTIYKNLHESTIVISFSTGSHWEFNNIQEKKRFENLKNRRGGTLPFDRYNYDYKSEEYSYSVADGIICLGDESVCETFSKFPLILNLNNASYYDDHYEKIDKKWEKVANSFLFFSGPGNVHKGLDLLLEAFANLDQHLYICIFLEPEFKKVFKNELNKPNIHYIGLVKQRSKKFYQIMDNCAFIIFPSCSEGSPGSVIECMNQGLIPIVSRESNIDVTDFGIFLNECTTEEIINVVEEVSNKPLYWIKEKSLLTKNAIPDNYSEESFLRNLKENIQTIIEASCKSRE